MKKMSKLLAVVLALGMLLSLGACGFQTQIPGLELTAVRSQDFDSPAEYYHAVELRQAEGLLTLVNLALEAPAAPVSELFGQSELTLTLDQTALKQDLLDLITQAAGMDLSWAKSIGLATVVGLKDQLAQVNYAVRVNGGDVIHVEAQADLAASDVYVRVPELSEQAFSLNLNEYFRQTYGMDLNELLSRLTILDPIACKDILVRYFPLVINAIEKVEVTEGSVTAGGVESACNIADVTVDGEAIIAVARAVLTTARDDGTVESLVYNILQQNGSFTGSAEEFHAAYTQRIDEVLKSADEADPEEAPFGLHMTVYIDAEGNILGRTLEVLSEDELQALISFLTAADGSTTGLEVEIGSYNSNSYTYNGNTTSWEYQTVVRLSGSSTVSALTGGITGEYVMSLYELSDYNGDRDELAMDLFTAKLDGSLGLTGFQGELLLTPSEDLMNKLLDELYGAPQPIIDLVQSLTLAFVVGGDEQQADCAAILRSDGADLLTLRITASPAEAFDISLPAQSITPDEWSNSLGAASLNAVINNLVAAGVPTEFLNAVLG